MQQFSFKTINTIWYIIETQIYEVNIFNTNYSNMVKYHNFCNTYHKYNYSNLNNMRKHLVRSRV